MRDITNKSLLSVGFAGSGYNEAPRLKQLFYSLAKICDIFPIKQILFIDHRSTDNTIEVLKDLETLFRNKTDFKWYTQNQDFSREYTLASIREEAVKNCSADLVHLFDADFIFGENYNIVLQETLDLAINQPQYSAFGCEIPVIREEIAWNNSTINYHMECIKHPPIPRIFVKNNVTFYQDYEHERVMFTKKESSKWKSLDRPKNSIASIDIKPEHYKKNNDRVPMSFYFREIMQKNNRIKNWTYLKWVEAYKLGLFPDLIQEVNKYDKKENLNTTTIVGEKYFKE